ncbi:hypothetical protein [Acanthamoeba castellanii mimivirus]|uniref:Uncharacterized protein L204 n=6 Tax=Mimivirus TaxID=315393 RepID=YL204_MIMIV|nr:hypothetical protein MIMI_gp0226 [Acanthamoeba polyphaga mimivirus]Q5UQ25.1 RecName: Full=Uncharacterized protein L204 [Acanthamoeba polyphaga mimivirus]ALR83768.1 hypothetical protein [Niemeyer virus]AMK61805.1 hypothetical protein [Samba virus]AMZ02652.1 hypothetical protein [Mimivirus Bombay]BAV61295.1 hypothetical protein [Acanthamoeba castellanii mimivirus]AAV50477.1 unknown [Acanthamoeba polyphaga mimivirus]
MNGHFKIIIRDNFINNDENNYRDLHDLATNLYKLLCSKHCKISLSNLCIVKYYFDVPHINFYVSLTDGLIIYNDETYIRISHLYPEFCAMDNIIINNTNITNNTNIKMVKNKTQNPLEHFPKNQQSMNSTTNFIMSHANTLKEKTNIEPENRQKNISKNKIPKQFQNHIQKNNTFENKLEIISETLNPLNPLKSLQNSIQKQIPKQTQEQTQKQTQEQTQESSQNPHNEENYSLKIRQFRGDKLTFKYMKKDIDSGVLKPENINPMFSLKYMIFKILDSRLAIDFNSDQNIQQEYVLFNELFKECVDNNEDNKNNMDNEEDSDESDIESDSDLDDSKSQNIEIPYKYFYLPVEEKESIAKKYGLNVSEFEDKYINKSNNKIQSINQENSNTIFSESVKSDSNESKSIKPESIKSESIKSDNSNNHKNFGNTDFENNLLSLENYHTF